MAAQSIRETRNSYSETADIAEKTGISPAMTYVYLIESVYYQGHRYVGITDDLRKRLQHHNEGKSPHTRKFKPWNLVSYTAFADERAAYAFEKYLKSGSGKAFLKRHYFRNPLRTPGA
jgi:putative endonuclease